MPEQTAAKDLFVNDEELAYVRRLAAEHGVVVEERPQQGIDPTATTLVVVLGSLAAVSTVEHLIDKRRGGQVIDLRPDGGQTLYRTTDLMYGLVTVLAADGTVTVAVHEPKAMFGQTVDALASAVIGLKGADMKQVATRIDQLLPPGDVSVSTSAGAQGHVP